MADYQSKEITSVDAVTSVDSKAKIFINNNGSFGQADIDKVVEKSALNTYMKNNSSLQTTSKDVIGAVNELNTNLINKTEQIVMEITDFNNVDERYCKIIFDQNTIPLNAPDDVKSGVLFQEVHYIYDMKMVYQKVVKYNSSEIYTRVCWYDNWSKWNTETFSNSTSLQKTTEYTSTVNLEYFKEFSNVTGIRIIRTTLALRSLSAGNWYNLYIMPEGFMPEKEVEQLTVSGNGVVVHTSIQDKTGILRIKPLKNIENGDLITINLIYHK